MDVAAKGVDWGLVKWVECGTLRKTVCLCNKNRNEDNFMMRAHKRRIKGNCSYCGETTSKTACRDQQTGQTLQTELAGKGSNIKRVSEQGESVALLTLSP